MNDQLLLKPGETPDDFLFRLGSLKDLELIQATWEDLADILNETLCPDQPKVESSWRKRYQSLKRSRPPYREDWMEPLPEKSMEDITPEEALQFALREIDKKHLHIREERNVVKRIVSRSARYDSVHELFAHEIHQINRAEFPVHVSYPDAEGTANKALYAMLSDIHYGLTFDGRVGKYDPTIAQERVMAYADKICSIGFEDNIHTCYVSLMGDLVSGIIHQTIRLENRENLIQQIIGVSELVAHFLLALSQGFDTVYVNSVSGNHSRLDPDFKNALRDEKVDALIPWYCKTRLRQFDNVIFEDNEIDDTVATFRIFDKLYVAVHGDMDTNIQTTAARMTTLLSEPIDYLLAGHLHVPEYRLEETGFIRNGSVCGSGDDYTVKKRLFSPPYQVCMLLSPKGVEAIYPVQLGYVPIGGGGRGK